jgi:hypothetical protein
LGAYSVSVHEIDGEFGGPLAGRWEQKIALLMSGEYRGTPVIRYRGSVVSMYVDEVVAGAVSQRRGHIGVVLSMVCRWPACFEP